MRDLDVAVVGGGLAGLAAATWLARAGRMVTLFEGRRELGGRASTLDTRGFRFNLGPHALYRGGPAARALADLGVSVTGGRPPSSGLALRGGELHALPGTPWAFATSSALGGCRAQAAALMARVSAGGHRALDSVSLASWLDDAGAEGASRELVEAMVRVSTYANLPDRISAAAALQQASRAIRRGVTYVDGGWGRLVEQLRQRAEEAGVRVRTEARVRSIDGGELVLRSGPVAAAAVVLALPADAAAPLLPAGPTRDRATSALPIRAACLDLGLGELPSPHRLCLGLDEPLYLSVHSGLADLAPPGGATLHVAHYLAPGEERRPAELRAGLESLLDRVQPGWRGRIEAERFAVSTVQSAACLAADGGLPGRPDVRVQRGLFVCGDWTGPDSLLADGTLASARRVVAAVLQEAL